MIFVICGAKNGYYESIEDARKDMDFCVVEDRERQWENCGDMVKLNGEWYFLPDYRGWNGEVYGDCSKYKDRYGLNIADNETYEITPVYMGEGEPGEDGYYDSCEIIGYVVREE